MNESPLIRAIQDRLRNGGYVCYYHDDRTHLGLDKQTPAGREAAKNPTVNAKVYSIPRLGGLHYLYGLAA